MNVEDCSTFDPKTGKKRYNIDNIRYTDLRSGLIQLIFRDIYTEYSFNNMLDEFNITAVKSRVDDTIYQLLKDQYTSYIEDCNDRWTLTVIVPNSLYSIFDNEDGYDPANEGIYEDKQVNFEIFK